MFQTTAKTGFSLACLLGLGSAALAALPAGAHGRMAHDGAADIAPPRGAHAGQCFAKVREPDAVEHRREQVMVRPAGSYRKVVPAVTRTVLKRVLVSPARTHAVTHPAVFRTVWRTVVTPGRSYRVDTPARYETVSRRVLVEPARTVWKRSAGRPVYGRAYPGQVAYEATGEVLCRVRIPARYAWTSERVLVSPGAHRTVQGAPIRRRVAERVEVSSRSVEHVREPAVFRTVRETVLVAPARSVTVRTPAEWRTVDHARSVPRYGWRRVVCDAPPPPPPPPCCVARQPPPYSPPPYGERG